MIKIILGKNIRDRTRYTECELYYEALTCPFEFKDRFNFELVDQEHRRQVLDIQDKYKITDSTITFLKRIRALHVNQRGEYGLIADRWAWLFGCVQSVFIFLMIAPHGLKIFTTNENLAQQLLLALVLALIYSIPIWFNYRSFMKPWLILRQLGCKPNQWCTGRI